MKQEDRPNQKIMIWPCDGRSDGYAGLLREWAEKDEQGQIKLTDDPVAAGAILLVNLHDADFFRTLRESRAWREFPDKCYGLYEGDVPPTFLRGMYAAAPRRSREHHRFAGAPFLFHEIFFPNPEPEAEITSSPLKEYLGSFLGRDSHRIRRQLLKEGREWPGFFIRDSSAYNHFSDGGPEAAAWKRQYWDVSRRSKFALCPRGAGPSSIRLFEMMRAGIAPVVISDDWTPPWGPDWGQAALVVPERRIADLPSILKEHEDRAAEIGAQARRAYESFFTPERYWSFLMGSIQELQQRSLRPESWYRHRIGRWLWTERWKQRRMRAVLSAKGWVKRGLNRIRK